MKKGIKVGLYDPYLDTLGGGEKHILSIIKVFTEQHAETSIFWNKNLTKAIADRFSFSCFEKTRWLPTSLLSSSLKSLLTLKNFDYFFYVTDGSYFASSAKNNFVFSMVPDKNLYDLGLINRLKLFNYRFISNSPYTTRWLNGFGLKPITITPYVDEKLFSAPFSKKNIILSVGRFFTQLHHKNQEKIIDFFWRLKQQSPLFANYRLILAGGLKKEDEKYFDKLKSLASKGQSIIFKPNASVNELYKLYGESAYFWHFTGLGVDKKINPEQVEHFGIAPLEAMASGCITFCHNSGGPKEIISDNKTGFLFDNEKELVTKMIKTETNPDLKNKIGKNGKLMVESGYNYRVFKKRVLDNL